MLKNLVEKIQKEAIIIEPNMVKVDGFLNHQIDVNLLAEMGFAFATRFIQKIDVILTLEASGIALALACAQNLKVPVLFAKKGNNTLHQDNVYTSIVFSATKKSEVSIYASKKYLKVNMKVLIIDDFLSTGAAISALLDLITQAKAECVGIGIAIEKGFEMGGYKLREAGYDLYSLAIIDKIENKRVVMRDE